jgi:uncharacterized protein
MNVDALIKIMPPITDANRPYWDGTLAGELRLQKCDNCSTWRYPEAPACPACLSDSATWTPVSGRARLWSWIVMHQNYLPAYADELPYLVAFVQLEEGPYLYSTIVDPPGELACDLPLEVVFERLSAERAIPKFRVAL